MNHDEQNLAGLTPGQHVEPEDLLLYVLDMLTPEERGRVEEHLEICTRCRQELSFVREDVGIYAVAATEAEGLASPPDASRERLLAAVDQEGRPGLPDPTPALGMIPGGKAATGSGGTALRGRPRLGSAALGWVGWAVAAALAVAATHFYQQREGMRSRLAAQATQVAQLADDEARARELVGALTDRSAQRVTLTLTKSAAPPQPTGRASYLANKGTLIFLASHMEQLPAGKTYELWVIPASGAAPVAAGTFQPDERGNASVVTAKLEGAGAAKAFGVTIEASGGSATPTLPILLAGS